MSSTYNQSVWDIIIENKFTAIKIISSLLVLVLLFLGLSWYYKWFFFAENNSEPISAAELIKEYNYSEGNTESRVVLVHFYDYECGACQSFDPVLQDFVTQYGERLKVVHKQLPIIGTYSSIAAKATQAAGLQGSFLEFKSASFDMVSSQNLTVNTLTEIATELGLDVEQWNKDRTSIEIENQVKQDEYDWQNVEVPKSSRSSDSRPTGTPTIILVKDEEVVDWWTGALPVETMGQIVSPYLDSQ